MDPEEDRERAGDALAGRGVDAEVEAVLVEGEPLRLAVDELEERARARRAEREGVVGGGRPRRGRPRRREAQLADGRLRVRDPVEDARGAEDLPAHRAAERVDDVVLRLRRRAQHQREHQRARQQQQAKQRHERARARTREKTRLKRTRLKRTRTRTLREEDEEEGEAEEDEGAERRGTPE